MSRSENTRTEFKPPPRNLLFCNVKLVRSVGIKYITEVVSMSLLRLTNDSKVALYHTLLQIGDEEKFQNLDLTDCFSSRGVPLQKFHKTSPTNF